MLAVSLMAIAAPGLAASDIVISQAYGGGGNSGATYTHDFIELFNRGAMPLSLAGWSVQYASASGSTWNNKTDLPDVILQPGQFFLVRQAAGTGGTTSLPTPDASGGIAMSATGGKVALVASTTPLTGANPTGYVDLVGYGTANHHEGAAAAPGLNNTTAAARNDACVDTDHNAADFGAVSPNPRNSATPLAPCGGIPVNLPIIATCPALTVAQGNGGRVTLTATGADSRVNAAGLTGSVPAGITPIYDIQGSGTTSPLVGQSVMTQGVVTRINNNGFFMQDETGDGDDETSDGISVHTGSTPTVAAGDRVQVTASAVEYAVGTGPGALANPVTQLTLPTVTVLASGIAVAPKDIVFPESVEGDLEKVEGMLVRIAGPLTVSQNYFLGRYGQLTIAAGDRLEKPTNRHPAGSAEALAMAEDNARRRLLLDDGTSVRNPNPTPYLDADNTRRAGNTINELVGVIDYGLATAASNGLSDYRLHPTQPPVFVNDNPRQAAPEPVPGNVRVAGFNVLNYFTTLDQSGASCFPSGTRSDCRGADSIAEFNRQKAKIVAALMALNADVVGLMEIENDDDGAVNDLVAGLNAVAGAGTYASVALPVGGTGSDAIRNALIYKPAHLTPAGAALSDTNPVHNRPPLIQTFALANGEKFTVAVIHFKSKRGCPNSGANADQGDGQGCWNALRADQSAALRTTLDDILPAAGSRGALVIGDLNAYGKEDPVLAFTDHGYVDQIARFETLGYSFVFDGEAGYLDHALASPGLAARVAGAGTWRINADEPAVIDYNLELKQPACAHCGPDYYAATPFRSSDHDPVIVGLNLVKTIAGTAGRDAIVGTPGDDIITGGPGVDVLTGGAGRDTFVYSSPRDAGDTITDFEPGIDKLDLRSLLQSLGIASPAPLADGYVTCRGQGGDAMVAIDADAGGPASARGPVLLKGVSCGALGTEDFRF